MAEMVDVPGSTLAASIEVSPKQVLDGKAAKGIFPEGTRTYLTDIGTHGAQELVQAARALNDAGYQPVPHIPARRIMSDIDLTRRIAGFTQDGGVSDVLVIAGEADRQMGPYSCAMDVLESGLFDHYGIRSIAVAGHPEGNTAYPDQTMINDVLMAKAEFAKRSNCDMLIATQFGFDPQTVIRWAERVRISGVYLPIHVGIAGPAKVTTLLKYAAMCGVGNSMSFLKKRAGALAALATRYSPEQMMGPLEDYANATPGGSIAGVHVFAFGGLQSASDWLHERGTWHPGVHTSPYGGNDIAFGYDHDLSLRAAE